MWGRREDRWKRGCQGTETGGYKRLSRCILNSLRSKIIVVLKTDSNVGPRQWLANFFCQGLNTKYFRFCRPYWLFLVLRPWLP